ncbi:MAG TPA: SDR family oxidoreductase [Acidimicrobiia bacterium]|nr:SDR family oxidoreductase [Acidimicrobiia bacterium]
MTRLDGRSVIVTGAATGIGHGIATEVAAAGAFVVLVDIDGRVGDVAARLGGVAVVGDVSDEGTVAEAIAAAGTSLRGLVNNAAIVYHVDAVETTRDQWDRTIAVNLRAPWLFAKAAIPVMLEAGGGSIVNVASIEATRVRRDHAVYAASKSGLVGLTRGIAVDYGRRGVRCNTISPGSVDTEMFRTYVEMADDPQAVRDELIGLNFVGRIGTEEEMGKLAVYMLSDDSSFMNGTDVVIDAGRLIGEN